MSKINKKVTPKKAVAPKKPVGMRATPIFGKNIYTEDENGNKFATNNTDDETLLATLNNPVPVVFDDEKDNAIKSMADAVKASQHELIHPDPPLEYLYGKRNVWAVTEEELLEALPHDLAYPLHYNSTANNRDIQLFLAGALAGLSVAVCNRFHVIPSNNISRPSGGKTDFEAYMENKKRFPVIQPCFLWVIIIAEMSVGKSTALDLFLKHVKDLQSEINQTYESELRAFRDAQKENGKDKETGAELNLIKPFRTVFIDNGPTEAALAYHLQYNPQGFAYFKDELASLFSSASMYAKNGAASMLDYLLPTYDGQGSGTLRKPDKDGEDASVYSPQAAVPIIGGVQPARLEQFINPDDQSGLATRLCVTRGKAKAAKADYVTAEDIDFFDTQKANEMSQIDERIGNKIKRLLNIRMIGQKRSVKEFQENELQQGLHKEKPAYYSDPYHLGLTTEALLEFTNFKKYLAVSIQNSKYSSEEMSFVDRDCDRILRIAGMLHCWQHIEKIEEVDNGFKTKWSSAREVANIPISLKTLQRAIIIVLFTMQTRRAEFPRFADGKKLDDKNIALAEKVVDFVAKDERFKEFMPFEDIKVILSKEFGDKILEMSNKALGEFFKITLSLDASLKRIKVDGKTLQKTCYRLSDAIGNWQNHCQEPISEDEELTVRQELILKAYEIVGSVNDSERSQKPIVNS